MEVKDGVISNVRFSTNVSGSDVTSTEQVATFEIGDLPVELRSKTSLILENGNSVVVAGQSENGLFKALAYKNLSKNVTSVCPSAGLKIFGTIFTVVGVITIPVLVGIIFTYVGIQTVKRASLYESAHAIVKVF